MIIITVQNGDSLYSIARRYGTTVEKIVKDNELSGTALAVGETLVILQPRTVYRVERGDNLYSIAQKFGVALGDLWRNNPSLGGKTDLRVGEVLTIVPEERLTDREVSVNAYVYPNVDRDVLRKTLPYLTYLTLFSYRTEEDGELIGIDDEELIELARGYGVAPIMLVSSLSERGTFSPELAEEFLSNAAARQMLIEEIATTLTRKRYAGVEVDFEYVPAEVAEEYVQFIRDLRARLAPSGYEVFVSLSPKTSDDQVGLLYEGHDYAGMGEAADKTFLMTYEWGYTYGPPMAVSPVNKVTEVIDYAVGEIPSQKIVMGVPNYGYDWKLPFVAGESRARSLGNVEAVALAKEKRARIEYDEVSAAPYFRYFERENGTAVEHVVWFENANSVEALIRLVESFDLDGIGIWTAMKYFPQLWLVLNATYPIRKILS
ncbi:MAG: LysM peptidoglycan-binding domain-containing protein [Clostridia bacterium]|nr:LysM peptidoglycan-binding domain-containing protein [Clostridia bacterium]